MTNTRGSRDHRTLAPGDEVTDEVTGERYRMRSLIGEGGMGRVFEAETLGTGAVVAVKCNQPIDPTNEGLVERARREGEFLKKLRRHPHIVPVLATGMREDGVSWMVMPYLDGASVGGLLSALGRIPLPWALRIAQATCSALAEAHRYAIHRDIKPENIFVTRQGGIYVLDFGAGKFNAVSRLTTTGTTLGTVQYSSPEQLTDPDNIDARSDLFSVGVVTFEMLAGEHPFDAPGLLRGNRIIIGNRIIRDPPRSLAALAPGLPRYMPAVVEKLLEKDREKRSRNAAEAERVFGAAYNELSSKIGPPPRIERIFEAYDEARRAEQLATQDTERAAAERRKSGPRPRFGTVPMAIYMAGLPAPGPEAPPAAEEGTEEAELKEAQREAPSVPSPEGSAGVEPRQEPMPSWAVVLPNAEQELALQRRLLAIDRLAEDDSPETLDVLVLVVSDDEESAVVRAAAASVLGDTGDEACLDALEACARSAAHPVLRRLAEQAVLKLAMRLGLALQPLPRALPNEAPASSRDDRASEPSVPAGQESTAREVVAQEEPPSPWASSQGGSIDVSNVAPPAREWSTPGLAVVAMVSLVLSAAVMWVVANFFLR